MRNRPPLSVCPTARAWLDQFANADQNAAAALIDAMLLLNEEQVSAAIRLQLKRIASARKGKRRRVALYAEREFDAAKVFRVEPVQDAFGRIRARAVGKNGPRAVDPVRGKSRVGSEGLVAFIVSQAKDNWPRIFMNHPGPDRIRGKTSPAGSIGVVTDFIGSGSRVCSMLDKLWAVSSVRAWVSRGWIDFKVIAAAATAAGEANVRHHRLRPDVLVEYVAPTLGSSLNWEHRRTWRSLIDKYGPDAGRGCGRSGFSDSAALVSFSYRIPNNTPALIHHSAGTWRALYEGSAPEDMRTAFGLLTPEEIISQAATDIGIAMSNDLSVREASLVLLLSLLRGRLRAGAEVALAERTGMTVPEVIATLELAQKDGLITAFGRLTDDGQALIKAGRKSEYRRPDIPTRTEPYYPSALRTPRDSSSTSRLSRRP